MDIVRGQGEKDTFVRSRRRSSASAKSDAFGTHLAPDVNKTSAAAASKSSASVSFDHLLLLPLLDRPSSSAHSPLIHL
jgi:hypothetical protein